jgi:hypothetical protein
MAKSKTRSLKKELAGGRGDAKSSHERVRAESTHAFLEALVGDFLVHEKRVVMQAAGTYCDLLRPAAHAEEQSDWALIGEASLARSSK